MNAFAPLPGGAPLKVVRGEGVREGPRRGVGPDHRVALIVPLISPLGGGTYLLLYVCKFIFTITIFPAAEQAQ